MTDRELLELIANQVNRLTTDMDKVKTEVAKVKIELSEVKGEVNSIKSIVIKIEHDHGQKLNALFDGYSVHSKKLDRIETKVSHHEELILKRLK